MIRDYNTYRKYIIEGLDPSFELEHYLQERGIEILKLEKDKSNLDYLEGMWVKSKAGKIYRMINFHGVETLDKDYESLYLVYWDWAIRAGGLHPLDKDVSFVALPYIGGRKGMSFEKCVSEIQRIDLLKGVLATYDKTSDAPYDPFNVKTDNRQIAFIEDIYTSDLKTFTTELIRKVKVFYRAWYFKDGEVFIIYYNDGNIKSEKINVS